MKRRRHTSGSLTAEQLIAEVARVGLADTYDRATAAMVAARRSAFLESLGYTSLDYFRARYALRRWGAVPPEYRWCDW